MDMPRYDALLKSWKKMPPVHVSVAAYVGWGKDQPKGQQATDGDQSFDELMAQLPERKLEPHG